MPVIVAVRRELTHIGELAKVGAKAPVLGCGRRRVGVCRRHGCRRARRQDGRFGVDTARGRVAYRKHCELSPMQDLSLVSHRGRNGVPQSTIALRKRLDLDGDGNRAIVEQCLDFGLAERHSDGGIRGGGFFPVSRRRGQRRRGGRRGWSARCARVRRWRRRPRAQRDRRQGLRRQPANNVQLREVTGSKVCRVRVIAELLRGSGRRRW